jgi:predicted AlkP superfamily phosphohydrolase/phosphomutase
VVGFCELRPAGHYLWPPGATLDDGIDSAGFAALRSLYGAIDAALGDLRAALPEDATMLVVSGDGVRPNQCGWHLLPAVMERLGYAPAAGNGGSGSLLGRIKQAVPPEMRRQIADHLPWWLRDKIGAQIQAAQIDWPRTRAFTLPTDLEGCLRINLVGREPQGIVQPGSEYRTLCAELAERLGELINPATGARAVDRVWRCDEEFPGPRRDHLPDLVVTWNGAAPINALESPRCGRIEGASPDPRTGTHSTSGFLLATGAGVRAGSNIGARVVDIAPTVLSRLGLAAHARDMDGQALDSCVAPLAESRGQR